MMSFFVFFFFSQKTAYDMRISDWSSDVCSSDLFDGLAVLLEGVGGLAEAGVADAERIYRLGLAIGVAAALVEHQRAHEVVIDRALGIAAEQGELERKSAVQGKSVSVRVEYRGLRSIKQNKTK